MSAASPCASSALPCPSTLRAPLLGAVLAGVLVLVAALVWPIVAPAERSHFPPEMLVKVEAMMGQ